MTQTATAPPPSQGADELLELRSDPPRIGELAQRARVAKTGSTVWVVDRPTETDPASALALLTAEDGTVRRMDAWPDPSEMDLGSPPIERLTLRVDVDAAPRYVAYLHELARIPVRPRLVSPWCPEPMGTHRLWAIAASRIALPADVRIEARHDLIGTRMAQLALAFGADALGGPVETNKKLPLAGVTRPTDTTRDGLFALIEQAHLIPTRDRPERSAS